MKQTLSHPALDEERAFGGLKRLHGQRGYERLRSASVAVVGVGGVGSWAVEALARSGVAQLVLLDLDHVSTSNINRQLQATVQSIGLSKVQALRQRVAEIHPACRVAAVEEFATPENWPSVLPQAVDLVIDACDQSTAKAAMAAWALRTGARLVCVGAAGGKQMAQGVHVDDLAAVTNDPLLAALRRRLRRDGSMPPHGATGLRCVYSKERVLQPKPPEGLQACDSPSGDLSCHGYGSSVVVTASFGMAAAGECMRQILADSG